MYDASYMCFVFFFNDTATTEIYTLSLHDALPICIHGQREADALVSAVARGDRRIDADHFAADVQQRSAAIARVDGRVGLQEMLVLHGGVHITLLGADDARRHGRLEAERRTDGHRPIAH